MSYQPHLGISPWQCTVDWSGREWEAELGQTGGLHLWTGCVPDTTKERIRSTWAKGTLPYNRSLFQLIWSLNVVQFEFFSSSFFSKITTSKILMLNHQKILSLINKLLSWRVFFSLFLPIFAVCVSILIRRHGYQKLPSLGIAYVFGCFGNADCRLIHL